MTMINSNDLQPTEADLARDLRADLEVCEKATPGPWSAIGYAPDLPPHWVDLAPDPEQSCSFLPDAGPQDCNGAFVQRRVLSPAKADELREAAWDSNANSNMVPTPCEMEHIATERDACTVFDAVTADAINPGSVGLRPRDAVFIATARAALPAAIRRAVAAEAEVQTLQAMVESLSARVAAQSDLLSQRAERTAP